MLRLRVWRSQVWSSSDDWQGRRRGEREVRVMVEWCMGTPYEDDGNPKSEIRMTNQWRSPNDEIRKGAASGGVGWVGFDELWAIGGWRWLVLREFAAVG